MQERLFFHSRSLTDELSPGLSGVWLKCWEVKVFPSGYLGCGGSLESKYVQNTCMRIWERETRSMSSGWERKAGGFCKYSLQIFVCKLTAQSVGRSVSHFLFFRSPPPFQRKELMQPLWDSSKAINNTYTWIFIFCALTVVKLWAKNCMSEPTFDAIH